MGPMRRNVDDIAVCGGMDRLAIAGLRGNVSWRAAERAIARRLWIQRAVSTGRRDTEICWRLHEMPLHKIDSDFT